MILLSHPTPNANVRAVLDGLYASDMLCRFYTSIASYPYNTWYQLSKLPFLSDFNRRRFQPNLKSLTYTLPQKELLRLLATKVGWQSLIEHEKGPFCIDKIAQELDQHIAKQLPTLQTDLRAVYAYEDAALATFKKAKELGLLCIYDLPIAYWETGKKLMLEEAERLPKWAITLQNATSNSEQKLARKTEELALADVVVGPGSFVMDSLPQWAKDKKRIMVPFGSPVTTTQADVVATKPNIPSAPLRVLFVGSMGQRKGLGDLFTAIKSLNTKAVELVVLGSLLAPLEFYKKEFPLFTYEATRSHPEVLALMRTCDVFCLPSLVEGRALVMQEAMSQGLPIIITANTGGKDLVIEGKTGFLVPIRKPEKIAEKITWCLENRNELTTMGQAAKKHAEKYTWKKYGTTIATELDSFIKNTDTKA